MKKKKVTEKELLSLFREEWQGKVNKLFENAGIKFDATVGGEKEPIISPDLKIVHKASGIKYTVVSVGKDDVIIKNPEGKKFVVDRHELESAYQLD